VQQLPRTIAVGLAQGTSGRIRTTARIEFTCPRCGRVTNVAAGELRGLNGHPEWFRVTAKVERISE
jgi:hypothetical protein